MNHLLEEFDNGLIEFLGSTIVNKIIDSSCGALNQKLLHIRKKAWLTNWGLLSCMIHLGTSKWYMTWFFMNATIIEALTSLNEIAAAYIEKHW